MKKLIISCLAAVLVTAAQAEERTSLNFVQSEDGALSPELFIPMEWSPSLFSGIGYTTSHSSSVESDVIDWATESKSSTSAKATDITLNLLTYQHRSQSLGYALGAVAKMKKINKNEFAYIIDGDDVLLNYVDSNISGVHSFDSTVGIDYTQAGLYGELSYTSEGFATRFIVEAFPYASLAVDQSTDFKPTISTTGTSKKSIVQELTYNAKFDLIFKTSYWVDLSVRAAYEHLPLSYEIAQADVANNGYTTATVAIAEDTFRTDIKFLIHHKVLGMQPYIGYRIEQSTTTVLSDDTASSEDITIDDSKTLIGFENRF